MHSTYAAVAAKISTFLALVADVSRVAKITVENMIVKNFCRSEGRLYRTTIGTSNRNTARSVVTSLDSVCTFSGLYRWIFLSPVKVRLDWRESEIRILLFML
jgi:hypothetical protein